MIRLLDVPALQFLKEIVDLARLAPQERVRVAEQTVAVPGPVVEGVKLRVHRRIFVNRSWKPQFHKLQSSFSHPLLLCQCLRI